jgi:hypothetical protein
MSTAAKVKRTVESLLVEWEKLAARAAKIESQRLADVKPHQDNFNNAVASINEAARKKADPIALQMNAVAAQIEREMKAGISSDGKTVTVPQVETDKAVTEMKDNGHRVIDPAEFFTTTPPAQRTGFFWTCVKIGIAPAEKFLSADTMKRLAQHEPNWSVKTRLKK